MSKILSVLRKSKKKIFFSFLLIIFLVYLKVPFLFWIENDNFFDLNKIQVNKNLEDDILFKQYISILTINKIYFEYNIYKYKCLKENNFKKLNYDNLWESENCHNLNNFLNNKKYKDKLNDFLEDNYELDENYIRDKINSLEKYKNNFDLKKNNDLVKKIIGEEQKIFEKLKEKLEKNKWKRIIINCEKSSFFNLIAFEQVKNSYILDKINEWNKSKALVFWINNLKNNGFLINNVELDLINFLALNTVITTDLESLETFLITNNFSEIHKKIIIKLLNNLKIEKSVFKNILKKEFAKKLEEIKKTDIIKEKIKWKNFSEKIKIQIEWFLFYNKLETEELLKQKYTDIIKKGYYDDGQINSLLNIRNYFWKNIVLLEKENYNKEFEKIEKNNKLIDKIVKKLKNN